MTRGFALGAALLLGVLAVAWWLLDAERDASRELQALTPPATDDARVDSVQPTRAPAPRDRAEPTPLAAVDAVVAVAEPEPPAVGGPFALRVTDVAGRPVVGLPLRADVRVQLAYPFETTRFAQTDAQGHAELGPLPLGVTLLWSCSDPAWFLAPREAGAFAALDPRAPDALGQHAGKLSTDVGPLVEFVARRRGASLHGTLLDAGDEPVADVLVRSYERDPMPARASRRGWRVSAESRTSVDGRFHLTLLAPGEQRVLAVVHEGPHRIRVQHASAVLADDEFRELGALPRDPLDPVQLVRAQPTLDGRPATPAEVSAKPDELRFDVALGDDGDWPTVRLGELPGDGLDVSVQGLPSARWIPAIGGQLTPGDMLLPHAAPLSQLPLLEPRVFPGAPLVLEMPFVALVTLELTLRDERGGLPVRRLDYRMLDEHGRVLFATSTDAPPPGGVLFAPGWPGRTTLVLHDAEHSGPHPGQRTAALAVLSFDVTPPGPQRVEVLLPRGAELSGTLTDAEGHPVRDLPLLVELPGARDLHDTDRVLAATSTDEFGAFHMRALPPDIDVQLTLSPWVVGHELRHAFRTGSAGEAQRLEALVVQDAP